MIAICAVAGGVSLFIAYMIAHGQNEFIELKIGAYVAIVGFTAIALINFLRTQDTSQDEDAEETQEQPYVP